MFLRLFVGCLYYLYGQLDYIDKKIDFICESCA